MAERETATGRRPGQREEYVARINRVIDYIEAHVGDELSLARLADVASFSRFHFHRVFGAMVGETLGQFIHRVRIEKAATLLLSNPKRSVTDIALACGFSGSAPFARAFKEAYGLSATAWRTAARQQRNIGQAQSNRGQETCTSSTYSVDNDRMRRFEMPSPATLKLDVEVKDLPDSNVAYVRHVGPYQGDAALFEDLFNRLMRWAGPRGLCGPDSKVMSVYHDNPSITDEDKLRLSACLTVPKGTQVDGEVGTMTVPGGRFAVAHFELSDPEQYAEAWIAVMGEWFPDSGYQPDDRLCFELYHNNPDEHPEGMHIVDICVPVRPL